MIGPNVPESRLDAMRPGFTASLGAAVVHLAEGVWRDRCGLRSHGDGKGASTYLRRFVTCRACLDAMGDER
jgi:hypothetical protein